MARFLFVALAIVLMTSAVYAQTTEEVLVSANGWSLSAEKDQSTLSVMHDGLGTVMKDVRLNLQSSQNVSQLKNWVVERKSQNILFIKTDHPSSGWLFKLEPNVLEILSTSTAAVLTAEAPAPATRMVARLIDPRGVPVTWQGTREDKMKYGTKETRNLSFLPTRNPECMYFGMGQISASNLHSLFDRKTDIAINFSDQSRMRRNNHNPDLLNLTVPVPASAAIHLIPNYFTKTLGVPFYGPYDDSYFRSAPILWNSWDSYYYDVKEKDIIRNTNWIAAHLKAYGFKYIVLDEGYAIGKAGGHYWLENWNPQKFPHGPRWLANYIRMKGLEAGLWFVPNSASYPGAVEQHPDWFVRYKNGKIVTDYGGPVLDSTNPGVQNFLRKLFITLDNWGFDYYKFDGEFSIPEYVPGVNKYRLYNKFINPIVAYRNRLKLIRETIGPRRFIEGCPAGAPLDGIGYFDSYFNGNDLYGSWQGMYPLFSSVSANAFLNHVVVYVMPGEGINVAPPMTVEEASKLRSPLVIKYEKYRENPLMGFGTTLAEARTLVTYLALTGVVYPVSSVMSELPQERVKLLKMTLPTMPILPIDLFSRGTDLLRETFKHTTPDDYISTYPEILDLKVNAKSGAYDVVGLTNWRSWRTARELSFAKQLGLDANSSYIVFDFWKQRLLGLFKGKMNVEINPHDTRVLLIHRFLNRPQLIGTSRHITGAYSIVALDWDGMKNTLSGSSRPVPGQPYSLWAYVPEGVTLSRVHANANGGHRLRVHYQLAGHSLKLSFQGQPNTINWQLDFTRESFK